MSNAERGLARLLLIVLIVAVLGAFLATSYVVFHDNDKNVEMGASVGKRAPNFTLHDLEGEEFSLEDLRGKIVIMDFMAMWCYPCHVEVHHLREINHKYDNSELVIVSIDVDPSEGEEKLRKFKKKFEANWRFASGPKLGATYEIKSIPTIFVLDKEGVILHKKMGVASVSELSSEIENVL